MKVDIQKILSIVDHTNLNVTATWDDIKKLCDQAIKYKTASVCIPPSYVREACEYVGDQITVCTVIGFPNGYSTTASKIFEIGDAINNGAKEIDIVINQGWVKNKKYDLILEELIAAKRAAGSNILKVIVETCLLTEEEKIKISHIVTESGADYIKTSTGFSNYGATLEDVKILMGNIGDDVKCKAAGGIRTIKDAEKYIAIGVSRLGTSSIVNEVIEKKI